MISLRRKHPRYERLSQLADSELSAAEAMEVNAHLAVCEECRAEVDFMLELRERLTELSSPPVPQTLLPEILSLRAMGDRVILDHGEFEEPPRRRSKVQMAAGPGAAALLFAGAFAFFGVNRADAGDNRFEVVEDDSGQPARLVFETAGVLAAEEELTARGVYHAATGGNWQGPAASPIEATLRREADGRYTADLTLPTEAVFAHLVVEDAAGLIVEGSGDFWGFMARRPDGVPTIDALSARARVEDRAALMVAATQTAKELTNEYPDSPRAWRQRLWVERRAPDYMAALDTDLHKRRLAQFVDRLEEPEFANNAEYIASVASYAGFLDPEQASELTDRLAALDPGHPHAVHMRVVQLYEEEPGKAIVSLEELWSQYGAFVMEDAYRQAASIAGDANDATAAIRWIRRWIAAFPDSRADAASFLGFLTDADREVREELQAAIDWLSEGGKVRPVGRSKALHRSQERAELAKLRRHLGRFQQQAGLHADAYRTLTLAAERAWDPELHVELIDLAEAQGARADAQMYRIFLVFDPLVTEEDKQAQLGVLAEQGLSGERLFAEQSRLRPEIRKRVLQGQEPLRPRGAITVFSEEANGVDLTRGLGSDATVVQFWIPDVPVTVQPIEELDAHCQELVEQDVALVRIASGPASAPGAASCDARYLADTNREAKYAYGQTYLGELLVLDSEGVVRFRTTSVDEARRAAHVIAEPRLQ